MRLPRFDSSFDPILREVRLNGSGCPAAARSPVARGRPERETPRIRGCLSDLVTSQALADNREFGDIVNRLTCFVQE